MSIFEQIAVDLLRAQVHGRPYADWVELITIAGVRLRPIPTHWVIGWKNDYSDEPRIAALEAQVHAAARAGSLDLQALAQMNEIMTAAAARHVGLRGGVVRDGHLHCPLLRPEDLLGQETAHASADDGSGLAQHPAPAGPAFRRGAHAAAQALRDELSAERGDIRDHLTGGLPGGPALRHELEHLLHDVATGVLDADEYVHRSALLLGVDLRGLAEQADDAAWADEPPF